jgi:hypothetical protein
MVLAMMFKLVHMTVPFHKITTVDYVTWPEVINSIDASKKYYIKKSILKRNIVWVYEYACI